MTGAALASAADLTKVDRTIRKEPAYQSKPKYGLLVFGPEAKFRIWAVLDGDVLYVDKNGNGDLTEASERVPGERVPDEPDLRVFPVGSLKETTGGPGRQSLVITAFGTDGWITYARFEGKYRQEAGRHAHLHFAESLKVAPVIHFDGPLTLAFEHTPHFQQAEEELRVILGTPGLGCDDQDPGKRPAGSFAKAFPSGIPEKVFPVAELEFPPKEKGGTPLKVRVPFRHL
jgi:hypothetical protein